FTTRGATEAVARPTPEGDVHDAQHAVAPPQRAVFLPGGARAIAGAGESLAMGAGFFLGRIVEADPNDLACGHTLRRQADDGAPELPALGVEGTPQEDREACKVLDGGRPGQPQRGCHSMAVTGEGPAAGSGGERVPRRGGKDPLQ